MSIDSPLENGIDILLTCTSGDLSVDVVERDGICPLGYICNATTMANCTDIRENAIENFKWGGIHDGIYCPEGNEFLQFCDHSYYCPDPETKIPCPPGKFCPAKTREPYIECKRCPEGSPTYKLNNTLAVPFIIVFVVSVVGYITYDFTRAYLKKLAARWEQLSSRIYHTADVEREAHARQTRLNQLRLKFQIILRRLNLDEKNANGGDSDENVALAIDSVGNVTFNEIEFFELLDQDGNGTISYEELEGILQLKPRELKNFVQRMNELDDHADEMEVSRDCFLHHFLDVLEECSDLQLTPDEAGLRWDEMAKLSGVAKGGKVMMRTMYESSISSTLSDVEISQLINKFRILVKESSRRDNQTWSSKENTSSRDNVKVLVDRDTFCSSYPIFFEEILVEGDEKPTESSGIDIAFRDLKLAVGVGRNSTVNVVDKVTGRIQRGKMTAVMGGSGAGKTSLLNALCGRAYYGEVKGDVFVNGNKASIEDFSSSIGFVPQDDIVYAELTVRENLIFSGRFRLPKGTFLPEIELLAETVMANLGLARKSNSLVGDVTRRGLSGGEKKRVNIGLELMARPAALFLDEPTSGLDSSSSLLVMKSLKQLSEGDGVTVCSVIHQPRKFIFDLYDSIVLLGDGGRMVYHGKVDEAEAYFKSLGHELLPGETVADWIIDISTGRSVPNENLVTSQKKKVMRNSVIIEGEGRRESMDLFDVTATEGEDAEKAAKVRRELLYSHWDDHFESMSPEAKAIYDPPEKSELPRAVTKTVFLLQLWLQIKRLMLLSFRNLRTKLIETVLLFAAAAMVAGILGPVSLPVDAIPYLTYEGITSNEECQTATIALYYQSTVEQATINNVTFGFCVALIVTTLMGITSARAVTEKRLEFFRESASGCSVNAYFLAINIYTFLEQAVQVTISAILVNWLWSGLSNDGIVYLNFILLTWTTVALADLVALIAPPDLSMIFVVFYNAFACFVLTPGILFQFKAVYDSSVFAVISAIFSPARFFVETSVVSDSKCLPAQTGFTVDQSIATNFPAGKDMFTLMSLGVNDPEVTTYSCGGWYWNVLPAVLAGLTVRFLGFGAINAFNRSVQAKKSLSHELRWSRPFLMKFLLFWMVFVGLVAVTAYAALRKG